MCVFAMGLLSKETHAPVYCMFFVSYPAWFADEVQCLHPLMSIVVRQESDDLCNLRYRLDVSFNSITHRRA